MDAQRREYESMEARIRFEIEYTVEAPERKKQMEAWIDQNSESIRIFNTPFAKQSIKNMANQKIQELYENGIGGVLLADILEDFKMKWLFLLGLTKQTGQEIMENPDNQDIDFQYGTKSEDDKIYTPEEAFNKAWEDSIPINDEALYREMLEYLPKTDEEMEDMNDFMWNEWRELPGREARKEWEEWREEMDRKEAEELEENEEAERMAGHYFNWLWHWFNLIYEVNKALYMEVHKMEENQEKTANGEPPEMIKVIINERGEQWLETIEPPIEEDIRRIAREEILREVRHEKGFCRKAPDDNEEEPRQFEQLQTYNNIKNFLWDLRRYQGWGNTSILDGLRNKAIAEYEAKEQERIERIEQKNQQYKRYCLVNFWMDEPDIDPADDNADNICPRTWRKHMTLEPIMEAIERRDDEPPFIVWNISADTIEEVIKKRFHWVFFMAYFTKSNQSEDDFEVLFENGTPSNVYIDARQLDYIGFPLDTSNYERAELRVFVDTIIELANMEVIRPDAIQAYQDAGIMPTGEMWEEFMKVKPIPSPWDQIAKLLNDPTYIERKQYVEAHKNRSAPILGPSHFLDDSEQKYDDYYSYVNTIEAQAHALDEELDYWMNQNMARMENYMDDFPLYTRWEDKEGTILLRKAQHEHRVKQIRLTEGKLHHDQYSNAVIPPHFKYIDLTPCREVEEFNQVIDQLAFIMAYLAINSTRDNPEDYYTPYNAVDGFGWIIDAWREESKDNESRYDPLQIE
jgi:hypothetical protein